MPKEVEIKFRVHRMSALKAALKRSGVRLITPRTHEMNVLYDLPGQQLRKRGELLRLRKYGKTWLLTHKAKANIGRHKSRVETETQLTDGDTFEKILLALGYRPSFRYEKFRSEWSDGKGHVVLDETPIGVFGEIEGPPRWIDKTAKSLGIARRGYITGSYAELFFAWKKETKIDVQDMLFNSFDKQGTIRGGVER